MKLPTLAITLAAITLAAILGAVSGFAQTNTDAGAATANAASPGCAPAGSPVAGAATIGTARVVSKKDKSAAGDADVAHLPPHQRNPVLADNGAPRAGKVIGSNVYDMKDKKIGSIDDILIGTNGQPDQAVILVGTTGRRVAIPFGRLVFGNTKVNGDNRVILPDETAGTLGNMPNFSYEQQQG